MPYYERSFGNMDKVSTFLVIFENFKENFGAVAENVTENLI